MKINIKLLIGSVLLFVLGFIFCIIACMPSLFQVVFGLFGAGMSITGFISIFGSIEELWYN